MAWREAYGESQQGLQGMMGQLMQQQQQNEEKRGGGIGGLFQLLGGAALMAFGNPAGGTLIASGLGNIGQSF